MATFEVQVEGLTGLTIDTGTSPTQDELTEFLKDGVIDVSNKCIQFKPQDKDLFMNVTGIQVAQGANIDAADIISVVRADGVTSGNFRSCRKISPSMQSRVADTESLHFASKFNPVYMINADGTVHVFPAPSDNSGKDSYKVYYVNNTPVDGSATSLTFADSTLGYFPADKVYLVVMYAGIKSLENALSAKTFPDDVTFPVLPASITLSTVTSSLPSFTEPAAFVAPASLSAADVSFSEVGTFPSFVKPAFSAPSLGTVGSLSLPSLPVSPALSSTTVSFNTDVPTYTQPVLSLESLAVSDLTISSTLPVVPTLSDNSISFSTAVPTYTAPVVSPDFSDASSNWLTTEEDSEMVSSRMQIISGQLQEYQSNIQSAVNTFNKENAQYQAELQEATENARLSSQDDGQKLQKYGSEVQSYQADVNTQVQKYQQNFQKDFQIWQTERTTDLQKYGSDMQNALNKFNKENAEYQAQLQVSIQNAQLDNQDEGFKLQKYSTEVQAYQAEVNTNIQEWTNIEWTQNFQKYSTDYQQLLGEYGQNIQNETARTQNEAQDYQQKVSKALQEYQAETGYDVSKQNADLQSATQRFTQDLAKENASYQSELSIYTSESSKISQDNQSKISKYSSEVQSYQAEISSKLQDYSAKIQKVSTDYQWMQSRQQSLKQEYAQAFAMMAPPVQQQPQQQARG